MLQIVTTCVCMCKHYRLLLLAAWYYAVLVRLKRICLVLQKYKRDFIVYLLVLDVVVGSVCVCVNRPYPCCKISNIFSLVYLILAIIFVQSVTLSCVNINTYILLHIYILMHKYWYNIYVSIYIYICMWWLTMSMILYILFVVKYFGNKYLLTCYIFLHEV